jgi:RimJ/RimL family protein N-acetyltransferase
MPEPEGAVREADARERKASQIIVTRRLRLRPLRTRDMTELAKLTTSERVQPHLTIAIAPAVSADHQAFAVERRGDRVLIGAAGYCAISGGSDSVEFALWISDRDWSHGYGTEAAQALIDRAFEDARIAEVWAAVRVTNIRGRRLLEKCGFQSRGTGMAHGGARGAFPVERFVLSRRAWASLKAWGGHGPAAADGINGDGPGSHQSAA